MKHFKRISVFILLIAVSVTSVFGQEGRELYNLGLSYYKEKNYSAALESLESFVNANPESVKYDDALWYLGRTYVRLDEMAAAEKTFKRVLALSSSNRLTEAGYDLGRIYFSAKQYQDVIDLLAPAMSSKSPDVYEQRSIKLIAMSQYNLGVRAKLEYRDPDAVEFYSGAAATYKLALQYQENPADKADLHYSIGKAYQRMLSISQSQEAYEDSKIQAEFHLTEALKSASEEDRTAIADLIKSVQKEGAIAYKFSGYALGGMDKITSAFGAKAFADTYLKIPLNFRNELEVGGNYAHNDFSSKASNFDDLKIGDARLIQTVDKVGADVSWTLGSRRGFRNILEVEGDLMFAEDLGDDYWSLQAANESAYRLNRDWKFGLNEAFTYKIYPDYFVAGNKLDHYLISGSPWAEWYVLSWLDIALIYEFSFKQYLASTYDTFSGAPSTLNKQYLINTGIIELDAKLGSIFRPALAYEITYQETNNYDYWVSGNPSDMYIEDYYDYLKHSLEVVADFRWSEKFRTEVGVTGSIKNFTNYIARDVTKTFTGDKRRDLSLSLDAEVSYILFAKDKSSVGVMLRGWYDVQQSNMTYETSFDTNHDTYGLVAGIDFSLR